MRIKIAVLCSLILTVDFNPALGGFVGLKLYNLIGASDLIVFGEIVAIDSVNIRVRIVDTIAGESPEQVIEVRKFEDWTCAARWSPYEIGQLALYFLDGSSKALSEPESIIYMIRGAAGEGEMHVTGGYLYSVLSRIDGIPRERHNEQGGSFAQKLDFDEMVKSIESFRRCFEFVSWPKPLSRGLVFEQICNDQDVQELRGLSPIGSHIVGQVEESRFLRAQLDELSTDPVEE